jgi:hypothetical protein
MISLSVHDSVVPDGCNAVGTRRFAHRAVAK